jgi:hypothetical protein
MGGVASIFTVVVATINLLLACGRFFIDSKFAFGSLSYSAVGKNSAPPGIVVLVV